MEPDQETQWDDDATDVFLKYGEAFVPYRQEQYWTVSRLVELARPQRVVELCCGEGKLCRKLLETLPQIRLTAYDGSERMLESAKERVGEFADRFSTQLFDVHDPGWRTLPRPTHAIVSSLALHHLTADEKVPFYRDMRDALEPGGVFVNADLVMPPSEAGMRLAADAWDRAVRAHDEAAFAAFESLEWNLFRYPEENSTDYPIPIGRELELLSGAGFANADVHWMYAGHAIVGAWK